MSFLDKLKELYKREPALINNFVAAALAVLVAFLPWLVPVKGAILGLIGLGATIVTRMEVDSMQAAEEKARYIDELEGLLQDLKTADLYSSDRLTLGTDKVGGTNIEGDEHGRY